MNRKLILGAASFVPVAIVAHAEIYLSEDQAVHAIFPGSTKFERHEFSLTPDQISKIEKESNESVRNNKPVVFVGPGKEAVFIDQVLGKHEFITIAVGIASDGSVRGVEVLEYRETYGGQVMRPEWRKQFEGKTTKSDLKLGSDIKNISGATLSSSHVTSGVRRLLRTYEVLHASL
jgi:Na+-translocating ferredoxin:NAD+ oxidoreductase RnfG subunit